MSDPSAPSAMPVVRALHKLAAFSDAVSLRKLEHGQKGGGVSVGASYHFESTVVQFLRAYRALSDSDRAHLDRMAYQLSCGRNPSSGALVGEPFARNLWPPNEVERAYGKWFDKLPEQERLSPRAVKATPRSMVAA